MGQLNNTNRVSTDEKYLDLMCQSNPDCLVARKFAIYEMVMGEDYASSERADKEQILAMLIYLIEKKIPLFLGGYDITFEEDTSFALAGLHEDVERFTAWETIPDVKSFLGKDKKLSCIIEVLILADQDTSKFLKDMITAYLNLLLYTYSADGSKKIPAPVLADEDSEYRRLILARADQLRNCRYRGKK